MRLIDADTLEKEIYKGIPKDQETWMDSEIPPIENLVVSIMMTIKEQETIDAVPVIRCKDCKFNGAFGQCEYLEYVGDYCSRAERKDEYVTLHHDDIHFIDKDDERAFYESLAERKEK